MSAIPHKCHHQRNSPVTVCVDHADEAPDLIEDDPSLPSHGRRTPVTWALHWSAKVEWFHKAYFPCGPPVFLAGGRFFFADQGRRRGAMPPLRPAWADATLHERPTAARRRLVAAARVGPPGQDADNRSPGHASKSRVHKDPRCSQARCCREDVPWASKRP